MNAMRETVPTTNPNMTIGRTLVRLAGVGVALAAGVTLASDDVLTKDLHVSQVPMLLIVDHVCAPELDCDAPLADPGLDSDAANADADKAMVPTLQVEATVDRGERGVYKAGEVVQLSVEVSEDAYLWIYDTGTSGKVHRIFPNRFDEDNFVRAGAPVSIPGADAEYELEVSHPRGRELLTVIATKSDSPLVDHLIDPAPTSGTPFAALGMAASVAKDISVSLRDNHAVWARDIAIFQVD